MVGLGNEPCPRPLAHPGLCELGLLGQKPASEGKHSVLL